MSAIWDLLLKQPWDDFTEPEENLCAGNLGVNYDSTSLIINSELFPNYDTLHRNL